MTVQLDRNMAMEVVRITESAALSAARFMGGGDKEKLDLAAVEAMRKTLSTIRMDGIVVIGEGEKDEAPMLYIGERVGDGHAPEMDIAVDPVDGTTLASKGLPGAISCIALSPRGTMTCPRQIAYMNKIAVGREARDVIDIEASVKENLQNIAKAKRCKVSDLTVIVLDRPRHEQLLKDIRAAGARVKLISDGDVAAGIAAAMPGSGVDVLMGIGGTPEAVLAAAAITCLGGAIHGKAWPRNDAEKAAAKEAKLDLSRVYRTEDMVAGEDVFFAATGVTDGEMVKGVRYFGGGAVTHSVVMRSRSGTIRWIEARHNLDRLNKLTALPL